MQYAHINALKLNSDIRASFNHHVNQLAVTDTAEFPLAFNVEMPAGTDYKYGNFSFLFRDFSCNGISETDIDISKCVIDGNKLSIALKLNALRIAGRYSINAKEAPYIDMDTAGNLRELEDRDLLAEEAGADSGQPTTPIDPQKQDAYLDNARGQRDRLMDTPNGQTMMGAYNQHNETYNELFNKSAAARKAWYAGGATAQMADDTHGAVLNNDVVNSSSKKYNGNVTYNMNAFTQHLNVVVNTANLDPDFDPYDPNSQPNPDSKYFQASMAALNFSKAVSTTGNTDQQVNELTSEQVHDHVKTSDIDPPASSMDELQNIISQSSGFAGADEAAEKGWVVLNEEQRTMVRRWLFEGTRQKAYERNNISKPIWTGECEAFLANTEAEIEITLEPSGSPAAISDTRLSIPAFEFSIGDAHWSGSAAEVVRERLSQIFFVKSLLYSQVEKGIRSILGLSVTKALGM